MSGIKISEVEKIFKEIFEEEEGKISSVETVYEKAEESDDYKLIISIHGLSMGETLVVHTKFIFKVDSGKSHLVDSSFIYLYDINCIYHKIDFEGYIGLKNKIEGIIESNDFGIDIQILSDFIEAPAMFLNYYLKKAKITNYSIFDVKYDPKFKTSPCDQVTFDFDINVNNNYTIYLSIKKTDKTEEEEIDTYKFHFSFLDDHKSVDVDTLKNIHFIIGSNIAEILDDKLK
jgi:hypothetical protein